MSRVVHPAPQQKQAAAWESERKRLLCATALYGKRRKYGTRWEKMEIPHIFPGPPGPARPAGPGWPARPGAVARHPSCGAEGVTARVPRGGAEGAAFGAEGATIGAEGAEMPTKYQEMSRTRAMCVCVPLQPGLDITLVPNLTATP
eukprot:gene13298-biopygen11057